MEIEMLEYSEIITAIQKHKDKKRELYTGIIDRWTYFLLVRDIMSYNWIIKEELDAIEEEVDKIKNINYECLSLEYLCWLSKWMIDMEKLIFLK